ncbi:hypothetical protein F5B20DRAFT_559216, partial [Whalleya microplaca]
MVSRYLVSRFSLWRQVSFICKIVTLTQYDSSNDFREAYKGTSAKQIVTDSRNITSILDFVYQYGI